MRKMLISEYHTSLARDEGLTAEFFARLKSMMRARQLLYGAREIGVALRPHLLTRTQYAILAHASEVLAGAFEKIASALLSEPSRMESVGLTEREIKLALVEPKHSASTVTSRLDAFVHGHEVRFVEYNAENPSGLTDQMGLNEILLEVGAMRDLSKRNQLRQFSPAKHLLNALLNTFREWRGVGTPNVAILDWTGLPTAHEFVLLQEFFYGQGIPTIICAPEELNYENRRLRCGSFRIDLVYKRVIINELRTRRGGDGAFVRFSGGKRHIRWWRDWFFCHRRPSTLETFS